MKKIVLLIFFIVLTAFAMQDQCFATDSSGLVKRRGDWSSCKSACADQNCYNNCQGRTRACFWGMSKTGDDFLKEWWNANSIPGAQKKDFCNTFIDRMDSIFQNDPPPKEEENPNILLASIIFWEKYKEFFVFCTAFDITGSLENGAPDFAGTLFGISTYKRLKDEPPEELFRRFLSSTDRDGEYGRGFNRKGYFYELSDKLNNEYKRIMDAQSKTDKLQKNFYTGEQKKNFITLKTNNEKKIPNIKLDEYISYLKKIKEPLSNFSPKWEPLIETEITLHNRIPYECHMLLTSGATVDGVKGGVDYLKKICNEYTLPHKINQQIADSLEIYYWNSAKKLKKYGYYLKYYPKGIFNREAEQELKASFVPVSEIVKKAETDFENGESLNNIIESITEYQENYSESSNDTLNAYIQKYTSIKDSVNNLINEWQANYPRGIYTAPRCSFFANGIWHPANINKLTELPEKNGKLSCYYPLSKYTGERLYGLYAYVEDRDSEDIFAIIKLEAKISNRNIVNGEETGFNPKLELVYKNKIADGHNSGLFWLNDTTTILFTETDYSINFTKKSNPELSWIDIQNIFYILNKNSNKIKHLNLHDTFHEKEDEVKIQTTIKKGKIQSISYKTESKKVTIPLNNRGDINGVLKYWDSNLGDVEITINGNIHKRFNEKGFSKIKKVKIKGCSFTPPRKIVGYRNTAGKNKYPIYETFSRQCENIAAETGMNLLLNSMHTYQADLNEFIPVFLVNYLDWNNME